MNISIEELKELLVPPRVITELSITIAVQVKNNPTGDILVSPIFIDAVEITLLGIYLIKGNRYWIVKK